jgi:hypothetical protein
VYKYVWFFYVLLTVHLGIIFVNNQLDAQLFSFMFISNLYVFRAAMCLSSGELAWSGRSARPRPTALLSPRSDGKSEAATAVVVASDDGHEDARNMLSCI